PRPRLGEPGHLAVHVGRVLLGPAADRQWPDPLTLDDIVDRRTAQHQVQLGPGLAQHVADPDDRVVLLLERGAVAAGQDAENLHAVPQHSVGMTRLFTEADAIAQKSAGVPRRTP